MLRRDERDDGGTMRHGEPELTRLRADMAFTRCEFALVRAFWLESKRQAAAAAERAGRRERFAARLAAEIEANGAMLLARLAALPLRPRDLPRVEAARQEALAEWDRRAAITAAAWSGDPERASAAQEFVEDALVRRFAARINAERQQALGVERYIWRSRNDARVRPLHAAHDDGVFFWDAPPEGGHPGEAYNCRCIAEPFVPDEPEWRPTVGRSFDRALLDANLTGAVDGVRDFVSDLVPSADDLAMLLEAVGALATGGSAAAELAYLVVKAQIVGLTGAERTRRDALAGDARRRADGFAAALRGAPELARALVDYVRAVEARPEALEAAHREGLATRADVVAAARERARMRTLAALYGLSTAVAGAVAARALVKRLLRDRHALPDEAAAERLTGLAARARAISPDGAWDRTPNPGIRWGTGIRAQGDPWERHLASRGDLGDWIEERAPNFKTFDFFNRATGAATSAKTLDTRAAIYARDPRRIFGTLKGYLDRIATFDNYVRNGYRISPGLIKRRRLELAIPSETTAEQLDEINRARAYAESRRIALEVTIIE
ncbi:minor capsid protein [Aquibium sp. A9E412]|uniref:endonuclease toxin domain-containing protein n=1 Tax=Aquibium sp. A9E412 TaxID=2976767 RepID=UPI0025AEE853|nr:phage minor head protein [Aquibium sp. A9E412]MDN2565194.1 minor capsid protein [Aquibium sp. A9E412]